MKSETFESSACFEDPRRTDLPLSADLYRKVRARYYGILFYDKKVKARFIKEWCTTTKGRLNKPELVRPTELPPHLCHPGLKALWDGRDDRNLRGLKMKKGKMLLHMIYKYIIRGPC